jgi:hypothetical protein
MSGFHLISTKFLEEFYSEEKARLNKYILR